MPILLLIVGILLVFAGVSSSNDGAYIGYTLLGLVCMSLAIALTIGEDA